MFVLAFLETKKSPLQLRANLSKLQLDPNNIPNNMPNHISKTNVLNMYSKISKIHKMYKISTKCQAWASFPDLNLSEDWCYLFPDLNLIPKLELKRGAKLSRLEQNFCKMQNAS